MTAVAVFCPAPLVTVEIERTPAGDDEIHVHAGGQGVWAARMARVMGADVRCCCPLAGETGRLLDALLAAEGLTVRAVPVGPANGGWVEDHRGGRVCVAEMRAGALSRHALDELFTLTIHEALEAGTCILTGAMGSGIVPPELYERLTRDLGANGCRVVADLSGDELEACLAGRPYAVKVDGEELEGLGLAPDEEGVAALHERGVPLVVVSRGAEAVLAGSGGAVRAFAPPALSPVETRGTGDSMTGALAALLAAGAPDADAVRLAVAAGALNVTRHGLGTGHRDQIDALAERVEVG